MRLEMEEKTTGWLGGREAGMELTSIGLEGSPGEGQGQGQGRLGKRGVRSKAGLQEEERQEEGRRRRNNQTPEQPMKKVDVEEEERVFLPAEVEVEGLRDWAREEGSGEKAALVEVNNRSLAVFKFGRSLLATEARCPHAGGPLQLGDIEVCFLTS